MVNQSLAMHSTTRKLDLDLPAWTSYGLNHFCIGQGLCAVNLHKSGLVSSDKFRCGQTQTTSHMVNQCANTMLSDGGL